MPRSTQACLRGSVVSVGSNPTRKLSPQVVFTLWPNEPTHNNVRMAFADDELDDLTVVAADACGWPPPDPVWVEPSAG